MMLRHRQALLVERSLAALYLHGNTLAIGPTGSGKTIMLSAVAGAFAQSWTRNPLADPGIIGLTAGASFFVAVFFTLGLTSSAWTAFAAIIGATLTASLVVAATRKAKDSLTLVLVGVGLTWALTSAATLLALQSDRTFDAMRQWNVGSTVGKDGGDIVEPGVGTRVELLDE